MKSECPTFLKSKSKVIVITLSDDEVSDYESGSDDDANFITFTATAIVNENVMVDENLSNGKLSENANLQETYNKLCKITTKDVINVDLS